MASKLICCQEQKQTSGISITRLQKSGNRNFSGWNANINVHVYVIKILSVIIIIIKTYLMTDYIFCVILI